MCHLTKWKHTNELIGFVDLGDDDLNIAAFDTQTATANHILAFIARGVASHLKYILGYFGTVNVTSYQLIPIFWKAVSIFELTCNLWVCAVVIISNGVSLAQLYHSELTGFTSASQITP